MITKLYKDENKTEAFTFYKGQGLSADLLFLHTLLRIGWERRLVRWLGEVSNVVERGW